MFPEDHTKIVKRIDELESQLYGVYRALESLRMGLQRQWHVLPSGKRWTQQAHDESQLSAK